MKKHQQGNADEGIGLSTWLHIRVGELHFLRRLMNKLERPLKKVKIVLMMMR